jgi:hypothetical protein
MSAGPIWSALPQSGDIRYCSGLTYDEGPPGPTNSFARGSWVSQLWTLVVSAGAACGELGRLYFGD